MEPFKKHLDHLKIEFTETQSKCDFLKVTHLPPRISHFPFYHILSFTQVSHYEILFLVAEVLDEDASSYCKYKLNYISAFILLDGFTMRILYFQNWKGIWKLFPLIFKNMVRSNDFPKVTQRSWAPILSLFFCMVDQSRPDPWKVTGAPNNVHEEESSCQFAET